MRECHCAQTSQNGRLNPAQLPNEGRVRKIGTSHACVPDTRVGMRTHRQGADSQDVIDLLHTAHRISTQFGCPWKDVLYTTFKELCGIESKAMNDMPCWTTIDARVGPHEYNVLSTNLPHDPLQNPPRGG